MTIVVPTWSAEAGRSREVDEREEHRRDAPAQRAGARAEHGLAQDRRALGFGRRPPLAQPRGDRVVGALAPDVAHNAGDEHVGDARGCVDGQQRRVVRRTPASAGPATAAGRRRWRPGRWPASRPPRPADPCAGPDARPRARGAVRGGTVALLGAGAHTPGPYPRAPRLHSACVTCVTERPAQRTRSVAVPSRRASVAARRPRRGAPASPRALRRAGTAGAGRRAPPARRRGGRWPTGP